MNEERPHDNRSYSISSGLHTCSLWSPAYRRHVANIGEEPMLWHCDVSVFSGAHFLMSKHRLKNTPVFGSLKFAQAQTLS